jgi:hypothetical protein
LGGEMEYDITAAHGLIEGGAIAYILPVKSNPFGVRLQVRGIPAVEIIDDGDRALMIARQVAYEVMANKAGAAGY